MAAQNAPKPKRKPRPKTRGVSFTIYSADGSPIPEGVVKEFEEKMQLLALTAVNSGVRLLTSVSKG